MVPGIFDQRNSSFSRGRSPRPVCLHQCHPHQNSAWTRDGPSPARGAPARQPCPPPAWNRDQLDLTRRCRIRPTDRSQDGSEEMVQPRLPGTHGDRLSPPHGRLFPLANPARPRGQWAGASTMAAASGLHPGEPAATPLGLGKPSGSTVTTSTFSVLGSYFCLLQWEQKMGQGSRPEKGKQATSYLCICTRTSSCKMNCRVVQETSLSPWICPKKSGTPIITTTALLLTAHNVKCDIVWFRHKTAERRTLQ